MESRIHWSVAAPVDGGVNETVSVTEAPAAMVVSSGSDDTARKPAEVIGGLDRVMAAAVDPVLVMVKARVLGGAHRHRPEVEGLGSDLQAGRIAGPPGEVEGDVAVVGVDGEGAQGVPDHVGGEGDGDRMLAPAATVVPLAGSAGHREGGLRQAGPGDGQGLGPVVRQHGALRLGPTN